jgi:protein SHQ1
VLCRDPGDTDPEARRVLRLEREDEDFKPEHYISDRVIEDSELRVPLTLVPACLYAAPVVPRTPADIGTEAAPLFSEEQRETMSRLKPREYLVEDPRAALYAIADVLFASLYDLRVTAGERNVESGWAVCKVSPTLSWFETFGSAKEALAACFRRALTYPMYRHLGLCRAALADVKALFALGRSQVLRALLDLRRLLERSEGKAHANRLYVDHFCVWLQGQATDALIAEFVERELKDLEVTEDDFEFRDWSLEDLDEDAEGFKRAEREEEEGMSRAPL